MWLTTHVISTVVIELRREGRGEGLFTKVLQTIPIRVYAGRAP